jgi:hypothetical protein
MKTNIIRLFWGLALILAGGLFLAENMGLVKSFSIQFWMAAFGCASLLFFVSYFLSGIREWGWLFPACIFAALALTLWLVEANFDNAVIGAPIVAGVGIPFLVGFALDRRKNWGALIPAWVLGTITIILFMVDQVAGEAIGSLVLFAIALPFLAVYVINRSQSWALIPAYALAAVGCIPLLTLVVDGEVIGAFVNFAIAAPFFVIYFSAKHRWWALIPAGLLVAIGLTALASGSAFFSAERSSWVGAIFLLGSGATFGSLWLRRESAPTAWALYPSVVLCAIALIVLIFGAGYHLLWALLIIAAGVFLIARGLRAK